LVVTLWEAIRIPNRLSHGQGQQPQQCGAAGIGPLQATPLQAPGLGCKGAARIGRQKAIDDGHRGADLFEPALLQSAGHVGRRRLFHRL
jgi:hypothetical protein